MFRKQLSKFIADIKYINDETYMAHVANRFIIEYPQLFTNVLLIKD